MAAVAALATVVLALPNFSLASFGGQSGKVFYAQNGDIWSIDPGGTGAVDLTPGKVSEQRPSPSADGRHVVFQAFRDRGWNIFSMNADGSKQVDLTNTREPVINFEPAFSPDGSKVVFMRRGMPAGEQDIWVIGANGTGAVDLTNSPGVNETAPEFSPDGTKIVYLTSDPQTTRTAEYSTDIWVMNADGSSPEQLTESNPTVRNIGPTWSPDSTKIAYSTVECPPPPRVGETGCGPAAANGMHVMNADGTEKTLLLNEGNPIHSAQLSWSPDGARIAFEAATGGIILTVQATGGAPALLVANSDAHYPSWAPTPLASGEEGLPAPGEGTPPVPPGGSAGTPPVVTPAPVIPARKPLKCGKGKKKKVVKGKVRCVKRPKYKKSL